MAGIKKVRALYDYVSRGKNELNVRAGEVLLVTQEAEGGWWRGRTSDGKSGWFPSSYVELAPDAEFKTRRPVIPKLETVTEDPFAELAAASGHTAAAEAGTGGSVDLLSLENIQLDQKPQQRDILDFSDPSPKAAAYSRPPAKTTSPRRLGAQSQEKKDFGADFFGSQDLLGLQESNKSQPQAQHSVVKAAATNLLDDIMSLGSSVNTTLGPIFSSSSTPSARKYQFSLNVAPIWQHPLFADIFLGAYEASGAERRAAAAAAAGGGGASGADLGRPAAGPPSPLALCLALEFMEQVLRGMLPQLDTQALKLSVQSISESLHEANLLAQEIPTGSCSELQFYNFLYKMVDKIKCLRPGQALVLPVGWHTIPVADGEAGKPIMQLGLLFCEAKDKFSFTMCNSGYDGIEWHPSRVDPDSGGSKHALALQIKDIPPAKVYDGAFWFLALRGLVYPRGKPAKGLFSTVDVNLDPATNEMISSADAGEIDAEKPDGAALIYDRMLPFLNEQPHLSGIDDEHLDWRPPALGGNHAHWGAIEAAIRRLLFHHGMDPAQVHQISSLIRVQCLKYAADDVQSIVSSRKLSPYHVYTMRLATKETARHCAELAPFATAENTGDVATSLEWAKASIDTLEKVLDAAERDPVLDQLHDKLHNTPSNLTGASTLYPHWDRLLRTEDVEALAGTAAVPPILRPVQLTLVPDEVANMGEAASAMRHALHVCTLLANQVDLVKNSYLLRMSLLHHLFCRVFPVPLTAPEACFWQSSSMRYETQADLLRLILGCARQYAAACLSLPLDRLSDASRLLTTACMAAIADAVMRQEASDIPSVCSLHYAGHLQGPGSTNAPIKPFGFEMGYFAQESEYIMLPSPGLHAVRTRVLDYFDHQKRGLDEDHVLFKFEESMEFGTAEAILIDQLCVQMGFARGGQGAQGRKKVAMVVELETKGDLQIELEPATYLSGESPEVLENYPELGFLRDIVFLLKAFMSPIADCMPRMRPYRPHEAILKWHFSTGRTFKVSGFGLAELKCTAFVKQLGGQRGSLLDRALSLFKGNKTSTRAPPSSANPSVLTGMPIASEDDVLHLDSSTLPNFDGRMGAADSEKLICYLTAPYLRIPLVLQLLAEPSRILCLASKELQNVLDAALFEPGPWQPDQPKIPPQNVPERSRNHLQTPTGLLFNELMNSPSTVIELVQSMLDTVFELDGGRYVTVPARKDKVANDEETAEEQADDVILETQPSPRAQVILYVVRLASRLLGFIKFIIENKGKHYRGLEELTKVESTLRASVDALKTKLFQGALPMIEQWLSKIGVEGLSHLHACTLHAHIIFIHKNMTESEFDFPTISCFLTSQVYLIINYPFFKRINEDGDPVQVELGVSIHEVFDIFTEYRLKILTYLQNTPNICNEVMESIVRVVTHTGSRIQRRRKDSGDQETLDARSWESMIDVGYVGRFLPDIDFMSLKEMYDGIEGAFFEDWLRQITNLRVSTEVNVQLGELTLKKNQMELLHENIARMPDFKEVYENIIGVRTYDPSAIHCAEVQHTTNRIWVRLVGHRHDLQCWSPNSSQPEIPSGFSRKYSAGRWKSKEHWISQVFEPWRERLLPNISFKLPAKDFSQAPFVVMIGKHLDKTGADHIWTLKEVVVYRPMNSEDRGMVQVFNVMEHGRRYYRRLIFSSNSRLSLHDLPDHLDEEVEDGVPYPIVACGHPLAPEASMAPSLVVTRSLYAHLGLQTFVPARLVQGLLPAGLLDEFNFWQNEDDSLSGYPKRTSALTSGKHHVKGASWVLKVKLVNQEGAPNSQEVNTNAVIQKTQVDMAALQNVQQDQQGMTPTPSGPTLTLINIANNTRFIPELEALANLLSRFEKLSHVLVWTADEVAHLNGPCNISLIELPRVGIRFEAAIGATGRRKYVSANHDGLFISPQQNDQSIKTMTRAIPHYMVLQNDKRQLFILVPAFNPVRLCNPNAAEVVPYSRHRVNFSASTDYWKEGLGETKHFLYPVHTCEKFLKPSSHAAALYLCLLRFCAGEYEEVFRSAAACVTDRPLSNEETVIFNRMGLVSWDPHPNAHACRLRLLSLFRGTQMQVPWDLGFSMMGYVQKLPFISLNCRLTIEEETDLLLECRHSKVWKSDTSNLLKNRLSWLEMEAKLSSLSTEDAAINTQLVLVKNHPAPALIRYDCYPDRTCLDIYGGLDKKEAKALAKKITAIFGTMSYSRPTEEDGGTMNGPAAIKFLNRAIDKGMDLYGKRNNLGFLFFYELFTQSLEICLLPGDSSHILGSAMLRLLPVKQTQKKDELMSILRCMAYNPEVASGAPKFEDDRKIKFSTIFKGSDMYKKMVEKAGVHISNSRLVLHWPNPKEEYEPPELVPAVARKRSFIRVHPATSSEWQLQAFSCRFFLNPQIELGCSEGDLQILLANPLQSIGLEDFVTRIPQVQDSTGAKLPFDLSSHQLAASKMGSDVLNRMEEDMGHLARKKASTKEYRLKELDEYSIQGIITQGGGLLKIHQLLDRLEKSLTSQEDSDTQLARLGIAHLSAAANGDVRYSTERQQMDFITALSLWLAKHSGQAPTASFDHLVALGQSCDREYGWLEFLADLGVPDLTAFRDGKQAISTEKANTLKELHQVFQITLLRWSRVAMCRQSLSALQELKKQMGRVKKAGPLDIASPEGTGLYHELLQHSIALVTLLKTKRHYVRQDQSCTTEANIYLLDPRFVTLEFIKDIVLRDSQVELVQQLASAAANGRSQCHQLIMGAGKTCVVAPLLCTMLANGKNIVLQMVPESLLEMGLEVFRSHLAAVLCRPVYTLSIDRYTVIGDFLLDKFTQAKAQGSVILTTPSALKSLMLKFIEGCHLLDQSDVLADYEREVRRERGAFARMFRGRKSLPAHLRMHQAPDVARLMTEAAILEDIFSLFQTNGVLLLDEVDTILHPLRSELNWPLGLERPLDFTSNVQFESGNLQGAVAVEEPLNSVSGLRWQVPMHLLAPIFVFESNFVSNRRKCAMAKKFMEMLALESGPAKDLIEEIQQLLELGCRQKHMQRSPHPVLLDAQFYTQVLRPKFAAWAIFWLRQKRLTNITDAQILSYLEKGPLSDKQILSVVKTKLDDHQMKMINLCFDWLNSLLPHVLGRINRVTFGLLTPSDLARALKEMPQMPRSRRLLAVPFVGKDVPSRASEFSHPDVAIGLTILSYRYEGLRRTDFAILLGLLKEAMDEEHGPYLQRKSCQTYTKWVTLAGGRVRGMLGPASAEPVPPAAVEQEGASELSNAQNNEFDSIWPLQLVDLHDNDQVDVLYELLHRLPAAIDFYLHAWVFPETTPHKGLKLQANGQDIGGDLFFPVCLAFSGTPSDLLPLELGACHYQQGDTARMVEVLTSPDTVSLHFCPEEWTVASLLLSVANSPVVHHALIDSGALITGLTNFEVACFLLNNGLDNFDGVIFLDDLDRQMVVKRPALTIQPLSQCNIPLERRFTFFDQIHTTGTDIQQSLSAAAFQTLGKDMTFRDLAQGAFRMRKIGQGQTLTFLVIPEVWKLIQEESSGTLSFTPERASIASPSSAFQRQNAEMLCKISAWATTNTIRSEKVQFTLLQEQRASNVWRKQAYVDLRGFSRMSRSHAQVPEPVRLQNQDCLNIFRERVDYLVANAVPRGKSFAEKINELISERIDYVDSKSGKHILREIQQFVSTMGKPKLVHSTPFPGFRALQGAERKMCRVKFNYDAQFETDISLKKGDVIELHDQGDEWWEGTVQGSNQRGHFPSNYVEIISPHGTPSGETLGIHSPAEAVLEEAGSITEQDLVEAEYAFAVEQVQEQEQEQEIEQEQEVQHEKEEEVQELPLEEPQKLKYARDHEGPFPWPIDTLSSPPSESVQGFYSLDQMKVLATPFPKAKSLSFPAELFASMNYFPSKYASKSYRRLKNISVIMEWTPAPAVLSSENAARQRRLVFEEEESLRRSFCLLDLDGDELLNGTEVQSLFEALDVQDDLERHESILKYALDGVGSENLDLLGLIKLITGGFYKEMESGRYFVVLSLAEAETLRAALHMPSGTVGVLHDVVGFSEPTSFALRMLSGEQKDGHTSNTRWKVLDQSSAFKEGISLYQTDTAREVFRFLDSQVSFTERQLGLLVRALQQNQIVDRQDFYKAVRACRRRRMVELSSTSLKAVFSIPHEFELLERRATNFSIQLLMTRQGLSPMDTFLAFNQSRTGSISCSELYSGLKWLGLRNVEPEQIYKIVQTMDSTGDGLVTFDEFVSAFTTARNSSRASGMAEHNAATPTSFSDRPADHSSIPRYQIPELNSELASTSTSGGLAAENSSHMATKPRDLASIAHGFKIKIVKASSYNRIWESKGVLTQNKVSVWAPSLDAGFMHRNRLMVCLGHFAVQGFSNPSKEKAKDGGYCILEISDTRAMMLESSSSLESVIDIVLPKPVQFRLEWRKDQAKTPFRAWRAEPPSDDYVALGMIGTTGDEPPPLDSMRCVPRRWLVPRNEPAKLVWDDKGTEGRPGSIWVLNSGIKTFFAVASHNEPSEQAFGFQDLHFNLTSEDIILDTMGK